MTLRFQRSRLPNTFFEVEQLIRSTFYRIITTATDRRDQLIEQLNNIMLEYFKREDTRMKNVSEIEQMIKQLNEMDIQEIPIIKLQTEQIKHLGEQQLKFQTPIPPPLPCMNAKGLKSLLEQLRGFGTVKEIGGPYRERVNPVMRFGRKEEDNETPVFSPTGLALYRNESIYVADTNNSRIQVFSVAGKFLSEFGKGQLAHPHSIALSNKWVFVGDFILNAVFKFKITNNKFVCQSARGMLKSPCGITTSTDGEVLVADCENNRIAVVNLELRLVREIGKDILEHPGDVKINNNNIFVADNNETNNIHIFTKSGDKIRSFIKLDNGTGYVYFCFDLCNNIIVSDFVNKSIQIFTTNGLLIHKIVCKSNPTGIAVDINNNIVCVCDNGIVCIY